MSGNYHSLYRRTEKSNNAEFNAEVQAWFDAVKGKKGSKVLYGEWGKMYDNYHDEEGVRSDRFHWVYLLWYDDIDYGLSVIFRNYDHKKAKVMDGTNPHKFWDGLHVY